MLGPQCTHPDVIAHDEVRFGFFGGAGRGKQPFATIVNRIDTIYYHHRQPPNL